jgi:hypothetical protein
MANKCEGDSSSKFLPESEPAIMVSVTQQSSNISSPALTSSFPITSGKNVIWSARCKWNFTLPCQIWCYPRSLWSKNINASSALRQGSVTMWGNAVVKLFKLLLYLSSNIVESSSPKVMSFFLLLFLLWQQSSPTYFLYWVGTVKVRKRGHTKILVKNNQIGTVKVRKRGHTKILVKNNQK